MGRFAIPCIVCNGGNVFAFELFLRLVYILPRQPVCVAQLRDFYVV